MDVMWCSAMSPTFWHPIFSPLFVIGYLYDCRRVFVYLYLLELLVCQTFQIYFTSDLALVTIICLSFILDFNFHFHQTLLNIEKPSRIDFSCELRRGTTCSINLPAKLICHDFQQQQIILRSSSHIAIFIDNTFGQILKSNLFTPGVGVLVADLPPSPQVNISSGQA